MRERPPAGDAEAQTELVCIRQQRGLSIRNLSSIGTQTLGVPRVEASAEATVQQGDAEVQTDDVGPKWRQQVAEANLQLAARWRESRFEDVAKAAKEAAWFSAKDLADAAAEPAPPAELVARRASQSAVRASPHEVDGRASDTSPQQVPQHAATQVAAPAKDTGLPDKASKPKSSALKGTRI